MDAAFSKDGAMDVAAAVSTYLEIVDSCAPGLVEGLYVVGSYALDDWHESASDIDIVAVTADPATDDDAAMLVTAHALLAEHQPRPFIDGPYLAWGDLVTPPMSLHRPWSHEGNLHHDGECFELNPVTWYVLATYGVTVRGPSTDELGIYLDRDDRIRFVVDNLAGYWLSVAEQIEAAYGVDPERTGDPSILEWCALGPLRLVYTAATGDAISKTGAGQYGLEVAPTELHEMLRLAISVRDGTGVASEVPATKMLEAALLIRWCQSAASAVAGSNPKA